MPLYPPKDVTGDVIRHDNPTIADSSLLIRHINPEEHVVPDENLGGRRIGSNAFSATSGDPDHGVSVDLGQLLEEQGLALSAMVPHQFGAVSLKVGDVRSLSLAVGSDPETFNEFHGQVWGVKNSGLRRRLHNLVIGWVRELPDVALKK